MLKNNYHTHMKYCNHAVGDVIDYVEVACEFGLKTLGMTDHAPILKKFMTPLEYKNNWCHENMSMKTFKVYLADIDEARRKCPNIEVLKGLESEYIPKFHDFYKGLRDKLDYMNLGVHYFVSNGKILNSYYDIDYKTLPDFVDNAILGIKSGLFKQIVHPDIFMYGYKNKDGKREFDDVAIRESHRLLKAISESGIYTEVNCGSVRRTASNDYKEWKYPYYEFWKLALDYDLKVVIGSDAHNPYDLNDSAISRVEKFVSDMGIKILEGIDFSE